VTVGFFAPLPPARTGVADYSAALLTELRRHGRVDIAPAHSDVALYQLGNNGMHAAIYRQALQRPGVVVLHDAVLHHFLLGQLNDDAYVEEFVYNYGEWSRGLAHELWRSRAASGADPRYFEYGMLRRATQNALAVVVHNPAAADAVLRHTSEARVVEIPHLFQPPAALLTPAEVERYRQDLGIPPTAFLFGVFGFLRESKRLMPVLQAFGEVRRERPHACLLVAGQFASADLERAVEPVLRAPGIVRLPYLKEREFWMAASAVDACINLRDPGAGESSGIAIRLMGIGKPVFISDGPEGARFPEDACIRIARGAAEHDSLRQHMILLTSIAEVARAIGLRGADHIREHHRVESIGKRFWDLLCEFSG
jgi:glycosyltransferase involved in cell wall biosynthesis